MMLHQAIEGKGDIAKDMLEQLQIVIEDYSHTNLSITITYFVINMSNDNRLKMLAPDIIETHSICRYYYASAPVLHREIQ